MNSLSKHVDLIAIGLLLCGIALYSGMRHAMILNVVPHQRITITHGFRPPVVTLPPEPRIPFSRD
jgi:hypothetical protein